MYLKWGEVQLTWTNPTYWQKREKNLDVSVKKVPNLIETSSNVEVLYKSSCKTKPTKQAELSTSSKRIEQFLSSRKLFKRFAILKKI